MVYEPRNICCQGIYGSPDAIGGFLLPFVAKIKLICATTARFMGRIAEEIQIKFRVKKSGCWIWEGKIGKRGYGIVSYFRSTEYAHRKLYVLFNGEIADGLQLHHVCGNRKCVNPRHLLAVTPKEHVALSPKSIGYINGQKTHCPDGHEYVVDEAFLKRTGRKKRFCQICRNEWQRRARSKF